jgi:integrase|tara:strand:- start:2106 stop:3269 length:1164 start_codon:yes stop_codon:yes gene_type:complete
MPKIRLTHQVVANARCEPGKRKTDLYDTVITGFVFEIRPSGHRTYYLRYQDGRGKQKQYKIAGYGDVTFDQARKEAQRLRSQVVLGGDPAAKKAEKRAVVDYAELAAQHLAYASTYQKTPANTESIIRLHLLPRWGKVALDKITQADVAQWLAAKAREGLAPATVEKIRVTFNRSFELAIRWNMPGVIKNPVKGIPRKPINNARERYLSAAEAKRLMKAVEESQNPQLKHIVGLLLLTGARVSELLHAKWKHIDKTKRQWTIRTSKNGRSRHVPLSTPALGILETVPRFEGCPYVVPNPDTLKPYVTLKHAWQTARRVARLPDLRIHDLRHSFCSFAVSAGIDLYTVGRIVGHADHKSTMRYSHLANDTLLAAVEAGAAGMTKGASQ